MPTRRSGSSRRYTSYGPAREALRKVLVDGIRTGRGTSTTGSLAFRACVALYWLLLEHPVDQWGRCRSCRRPGSVFGPRWRPCQVHGKANLVRQLDEVLLRGLLRGEELGLAAEPAPARAGDPMTSPACCPQSQPDPPS